VYKGLVDGITENLTARSISPQQQEAVTVHQTKVFAGGTMEFRGARTIANKYSR